MGVEDFLRFNTFLLYGHLTTDAFKNQLSNKKMFNFQFLFLMVTVTVNYTYPHIMPNSLNFVQ